jgi:lactoylglutathione lyase
VVTSFREAFPIVTVADVDRANEFYTSVFGFEKGFTFDEDGKTVFAFLQLEPLGIGVAARRRAEDPDFALWLYTDDVDEAAGRLRAAGADEVQAPTDQPWGERTCTFRSADGHLIHVGARS